MTTGRFYGWMRRGVRALEGATDQVVLDVAVGGKDPVRATLPLAGPGQVENLQPGAIATVDPAPGSGDHRAGALAFATLRDPALPWLMSPRAPSAGRLMPWLALICVPEVTSTIAQGGPLPILTAQGLLRDGVSALPTPNSLDLGAHVHDPDGTAQDVAPGPRAVSRVLCLQRLEAGTTYHACIVPVFEAGRLAGLGQTSVGADGFAWAPDTDQVTLPVYYHWRFSCGPGRGVEDVLRDLTPHVIAPELVAEIAVSDRFAAPVEALAGQKLPVRTLFSPLAPPDVAPNAALRPALAQTDAQGDPQLPLPSYGRDHAGVEDASGGAMPPWFAAVNQDPGLRRLAGAGAALVRAQQDPMVGFVRSSAGAIDEANAILGRAHAAKSMNRRLTQALDKAELPALARFAGPAADRIRVGSAQGRTTLAKVINDTDTGALSEAAVSRRAVRHGVSSAQVQDALGAVANQMARADDVAGASAGRDLIGAMVSATKGETLPQLSGNMRFVDLLGRLADGGLRSVDIEDRPTSERQVHWGDATRARSMQPGQQTGLPSLENAHSTAADVRRALHPDTSVPPRIAARLVGAGVDPDAPLKTRIVTEPVWPEPVIDQVLRMAPELLAPGLSGVPQDAIAGMRYDPAAMEAIMVGANHELMRELRWRGVPCDTAVSPVRRAFPAPTRGGTLVPDLAPLRAWQDTDLGTHSEGAGIDFVAMMRSSLIRRFPNVVITLNRAKLKDGRRVLDTARAPVAPAITGTLGEDLVYFGFPPVGDLGQDAGWFLTFVQPDVGLSFGINAASGNAARSPDELPSWNALSWDDIGGDTLHEGAISGVPLEGLGWGRDAGEMAAILLERPVTVALHLSDLLPAP